ncbi:YHYH domain-containing protein [Vibrio parahaemolyticus]
MKYSLIALLIFVAGNINAQPHNSVGRIELSHSGGTDKCGCHYNRKTGEYHCHTRKQRGGSCPP